MRQKVESQSVDRTVSPDSYRLEGALQQMPSSKKVYIAALAVLGCIGVGWWFLANQAPDKPKKAPPAPVTIAQAELRTMPLEIHTIGNVAPITRVNVKSRIEGHITKVHFKEGQYVNKGDLLFTIDPRPVQAAVNEAQANVLKQEAAVKQAEATLAKDQALVQQAEANKQKDLAQHKLYSRQIQRYTYLAKQGAVSEEQSDQVRANSEAMSAAITADQAVIENSKATVLADRANVQNAKAQLQALQALLVNAKLNLQYTSVIAPMGGRTGSLMAFEGDLVKANDATLVVLNQISPIYVLFAVPEQQLNQVRKYEEKGTLTVLAHPPKDPSAAAVGKLTFSENAVDATTGTIKLKATYQNADSKLWPGEFVDVVLRLDEEPNSVVVPAQAIQTGQHGPFLFIVGADNKVKMQPVKVDRTVNDMSVVKEGVSPGQRIVTDGQLQLNDGSTVTVKGPVAGN